MIQKSFILFILLLSSSCATIMNSPTRRVDILTNSPSSVKLNNQVLSYVNNRTKILTLRDIRPLNLTVFNDSIQKDLVIDSRSSFAYWLNIYANCGLGMIFDNRTPKRYSYPRRIYVDMTNKENKYTLYNPFLKKGRLLWQISLPWVNNFLLKPQNENLTVLNTGFWGIMTGLDYYYSAKHFVNLSLSAVTDLFIPVPSVVDYSGEYDVNSSWYASLSENFIIKRFSLGYGISFSRNTWDHRYSDWLNPPPPKIEPVTKTDYSFGFVFPLYMQAGEYFNIGLIYRPSFLIINPKNELKYEHLISIDFAWKIPLTK